MNRFFWLAFGVLLLLPLTLAAFEPLYERAPIRYHDTEADTMLTRLFESEEGAAEFVAGSDREILARLLDRLEVPVESQVLVFSKTSEQNSRISPRTPRAIYFSDDVYVGWVQGGEIEVASFDKNLGLVFHLVQLTGRPEHEPPQLIRDRSCLSCHAGSSNQNLPGVMVRSVHAQESGQPLFQAGTFHTRHDSPIEERWGGWYVTGEVEGASHMGNRLAVDHGREGVSLEPMSGDELSSLEPLFNVRPYLHRGKSDVVALMILEHQVGVHNALVEANLTTRTTLHRHREMQKAFGESPEAPLSETNRRILSNVADRVLRQMLYVDEIQLPGGVSGDNSFQHAFAANARKAADGRSLKDLRLFERLMKYRCSHLIHSEAFAHLPDEMRSLILERLHSILSEPGRWPDYAHLSRSEREHLIRILGETVAGFPRP